MEQFVQDAPIENTDDKEDVLLHDRKVCLLSNLFGFALWFVGCRSGEDVGFFVACDLLEAVGSVEREVVEAL